MKRLVTLGLLILLGASTSHAATKPNIIFVLTDDLGYGDYGVFFQNLRREKADRAEPWHLTPHIDEMAAQGVQLRQHYCPAPVCAPSRASLLLGVHQGHASVRDNQFDKALEDNHTLATVLKGAGYATAAIGKWGLQGGPPEKSPDAERATAAQMPAFPTKRGFDSYYGYIAHVDGHWHYPKEDKRRVWDNEKEVSADLAGCYTTDLFTARAKKWITEQHSAKPTQPFFLYLAYDTPHAKLQLPPGAFPAGAGVRGGLQWLGKSDQIINTADGKPDSYTHPDYATATWDHDRNPATPEQPWPDVYKRYATDVRRIDDCLGDLLQTLKDLSIDDDTLVVFTTDNGPSRESYLPEAYEPTFFNSFGPFDGIKRDCWEGGIRTGALVRWPGGAPTGRISELPCQSHDWMPTFAGLAGVPAPARCDGISLVPTITGKGEQKPTRVYVEYANGEKTPNYPEFEASRRSKVRKQMQAIREGDFVGVRYNVKSHADPFEIYNVLADPKETRDLAAQMPELQQKMHDMVLGLRRPNPSAPRPYDDEPIPAISPQDAKPGVRWSAFAVAAPWLARLDDLRPTSTGTSAQIAAPPSGEAQAILFDGYLDVPADGEYTFTLPANVTALLRVHDATVIDRAFASTPAEATGAVRLKAGKHPFRLYWQTSTAAPSMEITGPSLGANRSRRECSYMLRESSGIDPNAARDSSRQLSHVSRKGMVGMRIIFRIFLVSVFTVFFGPKALAEDAMLDTARIEQLIGAKGQMNAEEGVFKVTFPRNDAKVTVDGTPMPPFMGLTSWAAFKPGMKDGTVMVMGDMVLLQDEVNPVMSAALDSGLSVTALHNHFFFDEPRVYFMHIGGEGDSAKLAEGVRKIQDTVKSIRSAAPQPVMTFGGKPMPEKSSVTAAPLAEVLGAKATEKDGMVKFTIGRKAKMPCGCEVGKEMGVNTWAAFYGSDEHAYVDGDFATFDGELQPVLKALRKSGINVVAIHNHMEGETPRVIFLHYWGIGPTAELAKGLKAALDTQGKGGGAPHALQP